MILQEDDNLAHKQQYRVYFYEKNQFRICVFQAVMAYLMSNFQDFDDDHISLRFVQR